jgi:hypothetical protein
MRTRGPATKCPSRTPRDPATQRLHTWHGTRFARTAFCTLFILGIHLGPREVNAGTIYALADNPTLQKGYHITGTIETNGTTGDLTNSNFIQSWSVLITKDHTPIISFSSSTSDGASVVGAIHVTPTEIGPSFIEPISVLALTSPLPTPTPANLQWGAKAITVNQFYAAKIDDDPPLWLSFTAPTVFAAVPEPSSLAMAGLAGLCGLAYGLVRKRRSERRQGAAGQPQPTEYQPDGADQREGGQ